MPEGPAKISLHGRCISLDHYLASCQEILVNLQCKFSESSLPMATRKDFFHVLGRPWPPQHMKKDAPPLIARAEGPTMNRGPPAAVRR